MERQWGHRSTRKSMGEHGTNRGGPMFLDLDYGDHLSMLDESENKKNGLLEVLRIQGVRISLKINIKKTKLLRRRISEKGKVTLGNEKIKLTASLTLVVLLVTRGGAVNNLRIE
jgi:hypothetical protein